MPIDALYLQNFKGVEDWGWLELRDITLFLGPNSAGKSSAIHALAALSQTTKLPNNSAAIVLDDEHAHVHLGRFIEAAHSRSYSHPITLGIKLSPRTLSIIPGAKGKSSHARVSPSWKYEFTCSRRTQQISLRSVIVDLGTNNFTYTPVPRKKGLYKVNSSSSSVAMQAIWRGGLFPDILPPTSPAHFEHFLPLIILSANLAEELQRTVYLGPFR